MFTVTVERWGATFRGVVTCPHGLQYYVSRSCQSEVEALVMANEAVRIGDCAGSEADCACLKQRGNQLGGSSQIGAVPWTMGGFTG